MPAFDKLIINITGASHASSIGVEIEGLPIGFSIDVEKLQSYVDRRKSGRYVFSTPRKEEDKVEFSEGIVDGKITGKIVAEIKNGNVRSGDYAFDTTPRPSHADYVAKVKYGAAPAGGGRFSGRMTAAICIAGGIALQVLESIGVKVGSYISEIGGIECYSYDKGTPNYQDIAKCHDYPFPTVDSNKMDEIEKRLQDIAAAGDTAGGIIETVVFGSPVGIGGPLYEGLEGKVAFSLFAVPAVKSVESGLGRGFAGKAGTEVNDAFIYDGEKVVTATNRSGGINGGITNGMPITFRATFRPTPSVSVEQDTVDLKNKKNVRIKISGRHDVAFLPRAVVVAESAVALAYLDAALCENLIK